MCSHITRLTQHGFKELNNRLFSQPSRPLKNVFFLSAAYPPWFQVKVFLFTDNAAEALSSANRKSFLVYGVSNLYSVSLRSISLHSLYILGSLLLSLPWICFYLVAWIPRSSHQHILVLLSHCLWKASQVFFYNPALLVTSIQLLISHPGSPPRCICQVHNWHNNLPYLKKYTCILKLVSPRALASSTPLNLHHSCGAMLFTKDMHVVKTKQHTMQRCLYHNTSPYPHFWCHHLWLLTTYPKLSSLAQDQLHF